MKLNLTPGAATALSHASVAIADHVVTWFTHSSRAAFARQPLKQVRIQRLGPSPEDEIEIAVAAIAPTDFVLIAAGAHLVYEHMNRAASLLLRHTSWPSSGLGLELEFEDMSGEDFHCLLRAWDGLSGDTLEALANMPADQEFWYFLDQAKRWRSTVARQNFRELLREAETRPQILDRGGGMELVLARREYLEQIRPAKTPSEISSAVSKLEPLQRQDRQPQPSSSGVSAPGHGRGTGIGELAIRRHARDGLR